MLPLPRTPTRSSRIYGTSGTPYRIQIDSDEYFLVENHQEESPFDVVNWYTPSLQLTYSGSGLYILRLDNSKAEQKVKVVCADGNWNWDNPYWILNPFGTQEPGDSVPVYDRLDPNPINGLSDKDLIPHTKNGTERVVAWLDDATGGEKQAIRYKGIGLSMWLPDGGDVFSPWSNPPTSKANGDSTTLGIEVTGYNPTTGNINATFYTTDPEDASPARPQNLTATAGGTYDPVVLNWYANTEPDIDKYKIYRASNYSSTPPSSGYELIATINAYSGGNPVTSYTDEDVFAYSSSWWVHYKIKAVDSEDKYSSYSNIASYNAVLYIITLKIPEETGAEITDYSLDQNFPNPFNPTTTIRFGLPEQGKVVIRVYTVTGEYVATLVDREMTKGYQDVSFDASKLASGVYLYRIQAGEFTQVKKMMVIK